MKKLCLILLLARCTSGIAFGADLPAVLVGQWAAKGFEPATHKDEEPGRGNAIYLLRDGHAVVWSTEIGVPCLATYQANSHTLILKTVRVDKTDPATPTVIRYIHDPSTKTLKHASTKAPGEPESREKEVYRWQTGYVPAFVRNAWGQR